MEIYYNLRSKVYTYVIVSAAFIDNRIASESTIYTYKKNTAKMRYKKKNIYTVEPWEEWNP